MNKRIRLSRFNKVLTGVCGGIGEYFNIDPTFVRVGWAVAAFIIPGISTIAMVVIYLICWAVFPPGA